MARPPPFFLLVLVAFLLGPRSSVATAATIPPPTSTEGALNVGTVACLTVDARNLLVQQCQEKAKKMNKYQHVASCFDQQLIEMTGNSTSNLGVEVLICMDQTQIINALMDCARKMDPEDMPKDPGASTALATTQRTPQKRPKRRSIRDIFPSTRYYTPTFAGNGRKYLRCTREFPCCLFATGSYIGTCFQNNCIEWPTRC